MEDFSYYTKVIKDHIIKYTINNIEEGYVSYKLLITLTCNE